MECIKKILSKYKKAGHFLLRVLHQRDIKSSNDYIENAIFITFSFLY